MDRKNYFLYNSYLIKDEKTVLIDTVCLPYDKEFVSNLKQEIDLNKIDAKLNCQRIYLRIMKNNRWIDDKKYKIAFELLLEIGRILGGLIKYYAKDTKK